MDEFGISVQGDHFVPDLCEQLLSLDGSIQRYTNNSNDDNPKFGVLFINLGDGLSIPIKSQQRIAVEYLKKNRNQLIRLKSFYGVERVTLGLQHKIDLKKGMVGFCVNTSPKLMRQVLEAGISLNHYFFIDRTHENIPGRVKNG